MNMLPGFDVSFATLTWQAAKLFWDAGYRVFVQDLWTGLSQPAFRVSNLQIAAEQGFIIMGYAAVAEGHAATWHMGKAREGIPDDLWAQLSYVWVDVEEACGIVTPADVQLAVDTLVSFGVRPAVYTNFNTWSNLMGNPSLPAGVPLVDANFDEVFLPTQVRPYGTPSSFLCKQWKGSHLEYGVLNDTDMFDGDVLSPPPPPPIPPRQAVGLSVSYDDGSTQSFPI